MKSKTSFFNKTVFLKNLTRFAPVIGGYTLCLVLGMMMLYQDNRDMGRTFWFASRIAGNLQLMGLVNLLFAPLVAMLLFGDLYNARMCNALHAMPVRRETLFLTNVVSGLLFSMIPTAVMALLSVPLLNATVVTNAWQIALLWYAGTNLQFITFFGVAIFSVFCTGNRFAMAMVYAVLNGGAYILYYIINTLYTPMLFGVVTPDRWASLLAPVASMTNGEYMSVEDFSQLSLRFYGRENEMVAAFSVDGGKYTALLVYAAVGIVFTLVGLLLYRKRNLECAGDAIAFPVLQPLFQLVCAVVAGTLVVMGVESFFASKIGAGMSMMYLLLFCGGAAGWFGGKMLLKRTTRVFQLRSWVGLGILTAMVAVSLVATRFDVLGIEDRIPDVEDVSSVTLNFDGLELTSEEDIRQITTLHAMALEDRIESYGDYPLAYILHREEKEKHPVMPEGGFVYGEGGYNADGPMLTTDDITIYYKLKNGCTMTRNYNIWANLDEGKIVKEYASRWEQVWKHARYGYQDGFNPEDITSMNIGDMTLHEYQITPELVESLLAAVKADCDERTMTQRSAYHLGYFWDYDKYNEEYYKTKSLTISLWGKNDVYATGAYLSVFADSAHTLEWMREHDCLTEEVVEEAPIVLN